MRLFAFAIITAIGVCSVCPAFGLDVQAVTLRVAEADIHADLVKPPGSGPFPAVVWHHGGVNPRPGIVEYPLSAVLGELFAKNGYVLLLPHRRGYGRSPRFDLVVQFTAAKEIEDRNIAQLKLMDAYMEEVSGAVSYLEAQPYVDAKRLVVAGCSFGGQLALFASERALPIKAVVNFAGAAVSWNQSSRLRSRMLAAADAARVPVLLVQAENDYDLEPTRALARQLESGRKPHRVLIFPPHGTSQRDGHNFCETGGHIWGSGVFSFLDQALR